MTMSNTQYSYKARALAELSNNIINMNSKNAMQTTKTRQMTKEEMEQIFGDNPDYIKTISSTDNRKWLSANWFLLDTNEKFQKLINCSVECHRNIFIVNGEKHIDVQLTDDFSSVNFKEPIFVKYNDIDKQTIIDYIGNYMVGAPTKEIV